MTQAERERCERIEKALREALTVIVGAGAKSFGGESRFYDPVVLGTQLDRWQAALAPVDESR